MSTCRASKNRSVLRPGLISVCLPTGRQLRTSSRQAFVDSASLPKYKGQTSSFELSWNTMSTSQSITDYHIKTAVLESWLAWRFRAYKAPDGAAAFRVEVGASNTSKQLGSGMVRLPGD